MEMTEMTAENLQILNLSPIPEMSEIELSNILEQLSGLSELTGDLTDRNVEDILREAEELLDVTSSIKISSNNSLSSAKQNESGGDESGNKSNEPTLKEQDLVGKEKETNDFKIVASPKEPHSARLLSPADSMNHIKSTIDSLKEFSEMIENQAKVSNEKQNQIQKEGQTDKQFKNVSFKKPRQQGVVKNNFTVRGQSSNKLKSESKGKFAIKSACPTRLCNRVGTEKTIRSTNTSQQHKNRLQTENFRTSNGIHKNLATNRDAVDFKNQTATSKCQGHVENRIKTNCSSSESKMSKNDKVAMEADINFQDCLDFLAKETNLHDEEESQVLKYPFLAEQMLQHSKQTVSLLQKEIRELKLQLTKENDRLRWSSDLSEKYWQQRDLVQALKEENSRLFFEIKEMKCHLNAGSSTEVLVKEKQETIDKLREELNGLRSRLVECSGITRLEEQFKLIKEKYDTQISLLERENKQLKDALDHRDSRENELAAEKEDDQESYSNRNRNAGTQTEYPVSAGKIFEARKKPNLVHLENCPSPKTSMHTERASKKEISCQTEKERHSVSVQCSNHSNTFDLFRLETVTTAPVPDDAKLENKENALMKTKKPVRSKSAVEITADHNWNSLKQKKSTTEHENHLMATLRGLQSEILFKDKDNRKLKSEVEALRNQMKRLNIAVGKKKPDAQRKHHISCQTNADLTRAEYNPGFSQASKELEEENNNLKLKLQNVEEGYNQLKTKRINDLQILQDIHEEEIEKLASKLETQTSLARHLHSLLIKR